MSTKINLEGPFRAFAPAQAPLREQTPRLDQSFADRLRVSLEEMDGVTKEADRQSEALVQGEVDIHEAMIAMQKADLVIKTGTTIRNKLLEAYRDLSRAGG